MKFLTIKFKRYADVFAQNISSEGHHTTVKCSGGNIMLWGWTWRVGIVGGIRGPIFFYGISV